MYDHPDLLVLFSAGNRGAEGKGSVGSPGIAKNIMTIGASMTSWSGFDFYESYKNVHDGFISANNSICADVTLSSKSSSIVCFLCAVMMLSVTCCQLLFHV